MISIGTPGTCGQRFRHLVNFLGASVMCCVPVQVLAGPKVATDIAPVYALVARVMEGVGTPELVLPSGASPHDHALRPSEARMLANADLVVWVGPALSPQLERALDSLSSDSTQLVLLDVEGSILMPVRVGASFGAHSHDEEEDAHGHEEGAHEDEEHAHEDEDDEAHRHEEEDQAHGVEKDGHQHDVNAPDPHAWLDPENGVAWTEAIADRLATLDPENADQYHANAAEAVQKIRAVQDWIDAELASVKGRSFFVLHDATHYFEARFGVEAAGAIADSDAAAPGPARLREVRDAIRQQGSVCVFAEPGPEADRLDSLTTGTDARIAVLDPLGSQLPLGADLYPSLLEAMGSAFRDCL